jgi:NAD(P)-dependent dehydrogenase (short-subunit alcohol dehydrogenase family)
MTQLPELFNLSGRVALVTGAAGLLGREFSRTLVEAGAQAVLADLDGREARALAEELSSHGDALGVQVDVTDPGSVERMVAETLERFGRLDILVNSAALDPKIDPSSGADHTETFEDYPLELWNQALQVNLTGMFLVCQAAVRPMLAQEGGSIINICSIYGLVGPDQRIYRKVEPEGQEAVRYKPAYYSVTKAGVLGLTRYLATYYGGKGIRVNALTPGGVFNDHDEDFTQAYSARTVLGRMARKDELNGALLFLASDASSYMTGGNLVVDGGWTAW